MAAQSKLSRDEDFQPSDQPPSSPLSSLGSLSDESEFVDTLSRKKVDKKYNEVVKKTPKCVPRRTGVADLPSFVTLMKDRSALKTAYAEATSELSFENNDRLQNTATFLRVLNNLEVKTIRTAFKPAVPQDINDLLKLEPVRKTKITKIVQTRYEWCVHIRDANKSWGGQDAVFKQPVSLCSEKWVQAYAPNLVKLMDRWPGELKFLTGSTSTASQQTMRLIRQGAELMTDPQAEHCYPTISTGVSRGERIYKTTLYFIDPSTGETEQLIKEVYPSHVYDLDIPDTPPHCVFGFLARDRPERAKASTKSGCDGDDAALEFDNVIPASIDAKERDQHVGAIKILRLMSVKFSGKVMAKADLRKATLAFNEQYTNPKIQRRGPYDGGPLCNHRISYALFPPLASIELGQKVTPDVKGKWPDIKIRTAKKSRCVTVVDIITRTWVDTGDLKKAWAEGCKAADIANAMIAAGETAPHPCACSQEMRATTSHPCSGCMIFTLCHRLTDQVDNGVPVRICSRCKKQVGDSGLVQADGGFLYHRLKRLIKLELQGTMVDSTKEEIAKAISKILEPAWKEMTAYMPEKGKWQNTYTDSVESFEDIMKRAEQRKYHQHDPLTPTPDAVFPYAFYDGKAGTHVPGNLVPLEECLNVSKAYFIPAILQAVADYAKSDRSQAARDEVMARMDDIWLVGLLTAYSKKLRYQKDASSITYEQLKQQWVAAKPLYHTPSASARTYLSLFDKHTAMTLPRNWRPQGWKRFLRVVEEIEARFDHKFVRSADGCPYPFPANTMPADWEWRTAWAMFLERTLRMWLYCNGCWVQVDVPETLFLECLWQVANPDNKTLFKLPMTVYNRHGLRFVIAHIRHGEQLRSGWTTTEPRSIDDRDESILNMSIEPHFENLSKLNYLDVYYTDVFSRVTSVKMPQEYYNPDMIAETTGDEEEVEIDLDGLLDDAIRAADDGGEADEPDEE